MRIIKSVMIYPLSLVNNIVRILRFSIRTKITFTYLILYTWVTIFSAILVLGGYFYFNVQKVSANEDANLQQIIDIVDENRDDTEKIKGLIDSLELNVDLVVQEPTSKVIVSTTESSVINNYEELKNHGIYKTFPRLSLLRYSILPREILYTQYNIIFFYDVQEYLYNIFIMLLFTTVSYIVGICFIWTIGSTKTKKVLKPIKHFTKAAQGINAKNLDIRIDVGEAKYELKDLATTINGMMDRIEESYVKQQQFVSDVSHELRTPIAVINGYANMLDRWGKENPDVLQESIDALKNEACNMGDLVEKLLFLARYDGDNIKYEMNVINLSEIVDEIVHETTMIDKKHCIIRDIGTCLYILGDYNRIKQVIRIFADNAMKYTPEGERIFIKAYTESNNVIVSVTDTGSGISSEDLANIFDRFYRADKSRAKNTGGYGLGLSIARIIVLQHKGKIIVRSKLNVGSEFKILLPLLEKVKKDKT
ncbi:sensor histidine kinase [Alkalibaculum sporogenes]|nr:HAMP domain-containing sensor histidine kinase [Alkalibaculum sporogenes]